MNQLIKQIVGTGKGKAAIFILFVFGSVALFAPFIASNPASIQEGAVAYQAPGFKSSVTDDTFLLGTDQIGRDVWAGIVYGTRWALLVGFLATLISSFIGVSIGLLGGYFGDERMKVNGWLLLLAIFTLIILTFYIYYFNWPAGLKAMVWFGSFCAVVFLFLIYLPKRTKVQSVLGRPSIKLPLDFLLQRLIEIWRAVPGLFILLALLAAVKHPSLWTLIVILGLLRWTGIARLVRAELLHIREQNYIKSAQSLGFSDWHIVGKHVLPNALIPLFVVFAFSISGAIIMEATISFLGIGMSSDTVTWGSLMSAARQNYRAWWLAVFPGLCIFFLLMSLNIIGDELSKDG